MKLLKVQRNVNCRSIDRMKFCIGCFATCKGACMHLDYEMAICLLERINMRWNFSGGQIQLNRVIDSHLNQKIMFINCIITCGACYCEWVFIISLVFFRLSSGNSMVRARRLCSIPNDTLWLAHVKQQNSRKYGDATNNNNKPNNDQCNNQLLLYLLARVKVVYYRLFRILFRAF